MGVEVGWGGDGRGEGVFGEGESGRENLRLGMGTIGSGLGLFVGFFCTHDP